MVGAKRVDGDEQDVRPRAATKTRHMVRGRAGDDERDRGDT
jgi:hypothetical protein